MTSKIKLLKEEKNDLQHDLQGKKENESKTYVSNFKASMPGFISKFLP